MHSGVLPTLEAVVEFYDRGGGSHPNKSALLRPLGLADAERRALVAFLRSLTGDPIPVEPPAPPEYKLRTLGKN
jgi:cytochrome c peroxidase